jgi:hypothetical protein
VSLARGQVGRGLVAQRQDVQLTPTTCSTGVGITERDDSRQEGEDKTLIVLGFGKAHSVEASGEEARPKVMVFKTGHAIRVLWKKRERWSSG